MKREEIHRLFREAGYLGNETGGPLMGIVERFAALVEEKTVGGVKETATVATEPLLQKMDLETTLNGVREFFDGDFHYVKGIVDRETVKGQRQTDECRPAFNHCFVDQGGGGFTGDDFHGTVYFHVGENKYLAVGY